MGQRLVINVYKNHNWDMIGNIYFHWSAYSTTSLWQLKELLDCEFSTPVGSKTTCFYDRITLLRAVERLGGMLDSSDRGWFEARFPDVEYSKEGNRNDGLVAFSTRGKRDLLGWAEGKIDLFLDTKTFKYKVYFDFGDDYEDYVSICRDNDWNYLSKEDLPKIDFNLQGEISIYDLDNLLDDMRGLRNNQQCNFMDATGTVYGMIE